MKRYRIFDIATNDSDFDRWIGSGSGIHERYYQVRPP